ncbi:PEP/pyruvate-binding domain-containing protein [Actinomycetospora chibensis]|uniref:PEP/pyruvate-binding domain-containing protein n=1 Tax=Actinomycetospora chibensis TaxID=663606 RepID=A0ABV9RES4_9PSEU|nr:PEP/pyruvate-binding domain-containing protein [Actinomycetospora chibensis]MDD7925087.1 PEP/pyruvate-binding domain-containing protein [Actinomycetospora chibensis]
MSFTLSLTHCGRDVADRVGGKAMGLGELLRLDLPVPGGFAVTTEAYHRFVDANDLQGPLRDLLAAAEGERDTREVSRRATSLFEDLPMPEDVAQEVLASYDALGADEPVTVAVRSSATAEDTADASYAGQQETYLWIRGRDEVARHVVRCWASLFTPQAIAYRAHFGVPLEDLGMGVVVQRMVPARCAGVLMTLEPVTGDQGQIYLEATYGVGEGVVRGDVGTDRHWIDKETLDARRTAIGRKEHAHRFDDGSASGRLVEVPEDEQELPALQEREVRELADLGRRIEAGFGAPMDVEWAVADDSDPVAAGTVLVLQARPETVWSQRERGGPATSSDTGDEPISPEDDWDPLHSRSAPSLHWSVDNLGEAAPGVLTPLCWSLWRTVGERACREAFYRLGALRADERAEPDDPSERILRIFHGRLALQVDFVAGTGNRMPGTSGDEVVRGIFGQAPADIDYTKTRARYPAIAARLAVLSVTGPHQVHRLADETDAWWRASTRRAGSLGLQGATDLLSEASDRFFATLSLHTLGLMGVVQPVYDALTRLVDSTGVGDVAVLSGSGGAEMAVVGDMWRASRGEIDVDEVVARHGFHGPLEGELSGRVWREDDAPLRRLVDEYARRDDDASPAAREQVRRRQAEAMTRELQAAVPAHRRLAVRALLALAARRIPLRGVGKRAYLQSIDVARAAARRIGQHLVHAGVLAEVDDVFLLTAEELAAGVGEDIADLVARRRRRRAQHQALRIPNHWAGQPDLLDDAGEDAAVGDVITGVGVSNGVVEGVARVVTSPDFADVLPDEILVAPTTDPSWSSIMFVSAGLVVDIGGALSHAAVVARELGLPCVVSTRTGTRALRTGDRVRVDGGAGTVTILERASAPEDPPTPEKAARPTDRRVQR